MATVLICGGGFGGIAAALRLDALLGDEDEIVLIEQRPTFAMGLRKTWEVVGSARLADGEHPLASLAARRVQLHPGTITAVDPAARAVTVNGRRLKGDALVIAMGAELRPDLAAGFEPNAINVWARSGAVEARQALEAFSGGRVLIGVFGTPYACPPGPYELALLVHDVLARRGVTAEVEVFTPTPIALPVIGPEQSARLEGLLGESGIGLLLEHPAIEVTAEEVRFADRPARPYDLLFGIPPHRCPGPLVDGGLAEEGGWVKVDPRTLGTRFERVYAVGDSTVIPLSHGLPLPKAGVFAEQQGIVAAERIAAELSSREPVAAFDGQGVCYVEVGGGLAAAVAGDFYAQPPSATFEPPSAALREAKSAWEAEHLERWFRT